jgi:hypothetical protein
MGDSPFSVDTDLVVHPDGTIPEGLCGHTVFASFGLPLIHLKAWAPPTFAKYFCKTSVVIDDLIVSIDNCYVTRHLIEKLRAKPCLPYGFAHKFLWLSR